MKCSNCGKEIAEDSIFCEYCGARLKEEKTVEDKSSNSWKGVAIVFIILFVISLFVNIGNDNSSNSNEESLKNEISQKEKQISNLNTQIQNYKTQILELNQKNNTVSGPSATIANEDMNVVYRGFENRLNIAVPGVSSDNLVVEAKGATMVKPTGKEKAWICRPTSSANVELTVYAMTDAGKKKMGSHIFRTLRLPNPSAFLVYTDKQGETYLFPSTDKQPSRSDLLRSQRVLAQYADGLLKANFTVTGFTIYAQDAIGDVTPVSSNTDKITPSQMTVIKGKKRGSRLVIEDIRAKGPDGVVRELSPISIAVN